MKSSGQEYDGSNKRRRVAPRDFLGVDASGLAPSGSDSNTSGSYSPTIADAPAVRSFNNSWQRTDSHFVLEPSISTQLQRDPPLDAHSSGSEWIQGPECHGSLSSMDAESIDPVQADLSPSQAPNTAVPLLFPYGGAQDTTPCESEYEEIAPPLSVIAGGNVCSGLNTIPSRVSDDRVHHHSLSHIGIRHTIDEHEVCFGMIRTGSVKGNSAVLQTNTLKSRMEVSLKQLGQMTSIHERKTDKYIGYLDAETATALSSLSSNYLVHFDAYMPVKQRARCAKSASERTELSGVHVIIYGNHDDLNGVGKSLWEHDVSLQHPQGQDETVPYDNPHYLIRPGSEIDVPYIGGMKEHQEHQLLTASAIASIFVSSQGPPAWRKVNASTRLKTALKTHQKKGLAMMIERERGNIEGNNDFATLWTVNSGVDNKHRYKNLVTGRTQQSRPNLCLGGLLADEMGLGKTLTVLALIAESLDEQRTEQHTRQSTDQISHEQGHRRSTLIITPKSTLQSWDEQISKHVHPGSLKVHVYHGIKKVSDVSKLLEFDIVVTTYATLLTEWSSTRKGSSKRTKFLHSCNWHRVVLDEAHVIRDSMAKQSRAVHSLIAQHRWCLTGTPIQNRIEDLGALLIFLRAEPFDTRSTFKHYIADPINTGKEQSMERLQLLVGAIALRRTKESVKNELLLPPRVNAVEEVRFTASERDLYMTNRDRILKEVDHVYSEDGKIKGFCGILQSILRLRQICNYGHIVPLHPSVRGEQHDTLSCVSPLRLAHCEMCGKGMATSSSESESTLSLCMHVICAACGSAGQEAIPADARVCPLCLGTASDDLNEIDDSEDGVIDNSYAPSSKILALLQNLRSYRCIETAKPIKSVVFSCWTKMLDLLEQALNHEGISFARIDGKKTDVQRRAAIERFRTDPGCTLLLASIGSAGVGLDLTAACRVHLMEPQWNPMAEEQALDRVHRMGQDQEVHAIRYIVKDSIEEYVVSLQRAKVELFQQTFGAESSTKAEMVRKRLQNLRDFLDK
ncbi:hypothetical protein MMC11_004693 [Xylographa trunciseda]|nr:hypothetical protein [Xylographa trunciseda]